ncbi:MAG: tetratricopeptide repeat protein [Gemmatimonadota bacterium]|nr:MAG: tetratricopeptide repeat protein [Gemmatimonadota bacterium]
MTSTEYHTHRENRGLHEPFLARAADTSARELANNGLGAFLALRLMDQFAVDQGKIHREATDYQITATAEFLNDIYPCTPEVTHLRELVRVAATAIAEDDRRLLFPPLLAFAYWLEQELRLEEALDVLSTALRLSDGRDGEEEVAAHLNHARVLRLHGDFDGARTSYQRSGQIAARLGDDHSVLLSRIGYSVVLQRAGNLQESERVLREVVREAQRLGDADAEARACHDLGGTLYFGGRPREAIPLLYHAYELHQSPLRQAQALSDTGSLLMEIGCYEAAHHAFRVVLSSHPPRAIRINTVLEQLELSALVGDRVSFERWRQELANERERLTPEQQVDLELKSGCGFALFGQTGRGERHLNAAVKLAEQHGMGERIFHTEEKLKELGERQTADSRGLTLPSEMPKDEPGLEDTLLRLEALAADVIG